MVNTGNALSHEYERSAHAEKLFRVSDRYAEIVVARIGNIVITEFVGPCGDSLTRKYAAYLEQEVSKFNGENWAYLSVSKNFDAVTDAALSTLINSFHYCTQHGCVADAYVINSPVGKMQVESIRKQFPVSKPFDDVLFNQFEAAFRFLKEQLRLIGSGKDE